MIELEIQALSERREGLLIDVGKSVVASGFTLQRQRLTQDANGVLLTLVVRGPARKQRALEAALDAHERVISFNAAAFEEGVTKPHFAAVLLRKPLVASAPPAPSVPGTAAPTVAAQSPLPQPALVAAVEPSPTPALPPTTVPAKAPAEAALAAVTEPARDVQRPATPRAEPEFEFILPTPRPPAAAPAPAAMPFVDVVPEAADDSAVEKVLRDSTHDYPHIFPRLTALESIVSAGARESSLLLAGQRLGVWVFARDYAANETRSLDDAIRQVGVPALRALVEVEQKGEQLHIRNSPICTEGHSSCQFFTGFIEGLLGASAGSGELSVYAVCCRGFGADACVLAVSA